jgi:tetratricopeptide (TPR) repeat protein
LDQNPDYSPPLYNLGLYWELRKNPEEAWRYYRRAFRADASPLHREALTRLTDTLTKAGRAPGR